MKITLYEIDNQIEDICNQVSETGELTEEQANKLDELDIAKEKKLDGIIAVIKNNTAFIDALKAEKGKIEKKVTIAENIINRLKNYLKLSLKGYKYQSAIGTITYNNSSSVRIININAIPDTLKKIVSETKADKKAIKKALSEGYVPGAAIENKVNVIIK